MIKSMKIISKISAIKVKIKGIVDNAIEKIALHFVFIIGIGFTAIISKLLFKEFLIKHYSFTSWKKHLNSKKINKMY